MMLFRGVSLAIASTILLGFLNQESRGFSSPVRPLSQRRRPAVSLAVASSQDLSTPTTDTDTETSSTEKTTHNNKDNAANVPYAIARGDGSTGGGGKAMPKATKEEEGLVRPKVGAEMPVGRPDWFRVPAPSQGTKKKKTNKRKEHNGDPIDFLLKKCQAY